MVPTGINTISNKKSRGFRKLPILAGTLLFYFSFFSVIPFGILSSLGTYSFSDIGLEILNVDNIKIYIWGALEDSNLIIDYSIINLNAILSLLPWLGTIISAIFSFISSSYNENPKILKKLLKLSSLLLILILFYYITLYFYWKYTPTATITFGIGIIFIIIPLILQIFGTIRITDYRES